MIDFEFDDDKSNANRTKHGIDFLAAQELWNDPDLPFLSGAAASKR